MSEMIERVAKAMFEATPFKESAGAWEDQSGTYQRMCKLLARAAIKAMHLPTTEMQIAAAGEIQRQDIVLDEDHSGPLSPVGIYRAMIDAALHQSPSKTADSEAGE